MEAPSNRESKGLTGIGCHLIPDYSISFDHILNINAGSESSSKRWWRKQQWRNLCSLGARARAKHCFHPISHSPPQQPCYSCATPTAVAGWEEQSPERNEAVYVEFSLKWGRVFCASWCPLYMYPYQVKIEPSPHSFPPLDFSKELQTCMVFFAVAYCSVNNRSQRLQ